MNEYSPLLGSPPAVGADGPVVVYKIQHETDVQVGLCCMGDGVRTDVLCEICNAWVCKAHFCTYRGNDKIATTDMDPLFCVSRTFMKQVFFSPVCPRCSLSEEPPPDSSRTYFNTKGKVFVIVLVLLAVAIGALVLMS